MIQAPWVRQISCICKVRKAFSQPSPNPSALSLTSRGEPNVAVTASIAGPNATRTEGSVVGEGVLHQHMAELVPGNETGGAMRVPLL